MKYQYKAQFESFSNYAELKFLLSYGECPTFKTPNLTISMWKQKYQMLLVLRKFFQNLHQPIWIIEIDCLHSSNAQSPLNIESEQTSYLYNLDKVEIFENFPIWQALFSNTKKYDYLYI